MQDRLQFAQLQQCYESEWQNMTGNIFFCHSTRKEATFYLCCLNLFLGTNKKNVQNKE